MTKCDGWGEQKPHKTDEELATVTIPKSQGGPETRKLCEWCLEAWVLAWLCKYRPDRGGGGMNEDRKTFLPCGCVIVQSSGHLPNVLFCNLHAAAPELLEVCEALVDFAIWMSGSSSFSPGGEAHRGWMNMHGVLDKGKAIINKVRREAPPCP
jgi:hypothetical protein